jgi:hypothetical protein
MSSGRGASSGSGEHRDELVEDQMERRIEWPSIGLPMAASAAGSRLVGPGPHSSSGGAMAAVGLPMLRNAELSQKALIGYGR